MHRYKKISEQSTQLLYKEIKKTERTRDMARIRTVARRPSRNEPGTACKGGG